MKSTHAEQPWAFPKRQFGATLEIPVATRLHKLLGLTAPKRGCTRPLVVALLVLPLWIAAARSRDSIERGSPQVTPTGDAPQGLASSSAVLQPVSRWFQGPAFPGTASVPEPLDRSVSAGNPFSRAWPSVDLLAPQPDSLSTPGLSSPHDSTVRELPATQPSSFAQGFDALPELTFFDRAHKRYAQCRLYSAAGAVDEVAAQKLDQFLADLRDPERPKVGRMDRRLLQLIFRVAYHFGAKQIDVLSAYREQTKRREGLHALGRALDFGIPGVKLEALASYLRKQPKVGVGIYTHRRTRFVHLDVRDQSYHWLDASPPGRTWRGMSIGDRSLVTRDRAYQERDDWPEGLANARAP